jgi:hypothetical protein
MTANLSSPPTKRDRRTVVSISSGITLVVVGFLLFLSFKMFLNDDDAYLNIAIFMASSSVGWLLGTFNSPKNSKEKVIFGEYGKAVSAFISGYLVSKLDKLVEMILSPTTLQVPVASFRLVGSTSCFVTAMLITYVIGAYVFASSESVNSATTGAPKELDTKNS